MNILGGYGYQPALASMKACGFSRKRDYFVVTIKLTCHVGIGPKVEGLALVADDNFSARYDLDRIKGCFLGQHKLLDKVIRTSFWC